ncbi:uncharacterized protein LOC133289434 [Gastrolobium bilobum]|uniref:uncharacterized protein LOC133289434 n=1 Tax=Gastrolobium bilobum TaxID=150636 RepID=UPI002AB01934|nr:uncharacterized protein LOC133289434 [Gastrolobium bilobum]
MDINEWVLLSDDGFLDKNEDGDDENQILLGKRNSDSKSVFDNYFCTSPKSRKTIEPPRNHPSVVPKQLVHVPIQLEPRIGKVPDDGLVEENTKDDVGVTLIPSPPTIEKTKASQVGGTVVEADEDTVSQVFFKIKENEFVDMKMDSPKSCGRGLFPPLDASGALKFEDKDEAMEIMASPRMKIEKEMVIMNCDKEEEDEEDTTDGFNLWKWSLTGVGAICSFGVAAATICVLFFGSQQRNKPHQDQKIRFQIYADDKRIKEMVQHATKLNEAISAVRGVPLSRAHITYGGYYDGL